MSETICRICDSKNVKKFKISDLNRNNSKKLYEYLLCNNCKIISFLSKNVDFNKYYKSSQSPFELSNQRYKNIVNKNYYFFNIFKKFIKNGSVLEIGPDLFQVQIHFL